MAGSLKWPAGIGRKVFAFFVVMASLTAAHAMAQEGLTTIRSNYGPKETMDRLEAEVRSKGLTVFAHIDHAAGAAQVGLQLRPTDLLIFGNAKGGTPLMQANQEIGIDLPLKILVWQDQAGITWLSYNDQAGSRNVMRSAVTRKPPSIRWATWLARSPRLQLTRDRGRASSQRLE